MQQGTIVYCKSSNPVNGVGSQKGNRIYQPWTNDINGELDFLKDKDTTPTGVGVPLFIGDATNAPEREKQLQFSFGDTVGTFLGVIKYLNGVAYAKVAMTIRGYYGSGDDIPVTAYLWIDNSVLTDDQSELLTLAKNGESGGVDPNALKKKLTGNTNTGTGGNGNGNSSNLLTYVLGFVGLTVIGFLLFKLFNKKS